MSDLLTVVAWIRAAPGAEDTVRETLMAIIPPTLEEEGCIDYRLHVVNDDPGLFYFVENWRSTEDLDRHLESPHIRKARTVLEGHVGTSEEKRMTRIA